MQGLARIAVLWCMIVATLPAGFAFSEPVNPSCRKGAPSGFPGSEILRYVVNAFMLTDVAEADIFAKQISKTRPLMVETGLVARTKGIAAIFSGDLYQEHRSLAVEWPDETSPRLYRFVSVQYVLFQKGGLNPTHLRFKADYVAGRLYRERLTPPLVGGDEKPFSQWVIPLGRFYEDPLTALLNFRQNRRRLPAKGEEIVVKTFPFESDLPYEEIRIRRASLEEEEEYRISDGIQSGEVLILVDAPPGFLSKGQRIRTRILFDEKTLLPRRATAEKVVPLLFSYGDAVGLFVCFGRSN